MNNLKGKKLKLTKISDEVFNGEHPNDINVGYITEGWCVNGIQKGYSCVLYYYNTNSTSKLGQYPVFWTSVVDSWDEENMIIRTQNSKYKVEVL